MARSPASTGLLPMPGSASSSWAIYRARIASILSSPDSSVFIAFWLFGLINNVLYVIILSAAQDLVGADIPKGVVLLADILPGFLTKLLAPYLLDRVPYATRVVFFAAGSSIGMLLVALTDNDAVSLKMAGIAIASVTSGGGESSFLGLMHYFGHTSLAAWGSGTGGAGLVGAGLYVVLTDWLGLSVRDSLLISAALPVVMLISYFCVLPRGPLRGAIQSKEYRAVPEQDPEDLPEDDLLSPSSANAFPTSSDGVVLAKLLRAKSLVVPYMVPLLLVYIAEYTINQGVSPTLLFPLESSPFKEFRAFYPFYGFLYQLGVFISRTSIAFLRVRNLYTPSLLQVTNLVLLFLHAMFFFIPSVYLVFLVIFWEGLLGGAVYVNTFAEIMERVPASEREFSLSATTVSDSGGICIAAFMSMAIEPFLCNYQVQKGRDWCKRIKIG